MGEWADSILDGVFCQVCGEYLGEGDGFPTECESCKEDESRHDEVKAVLLSMRKKHKARKK